MAPISHARASIAFGRFRISRHRRELLADDRPLKLGGRAFDVLMALIETPGAIIGKDVLMARVWPDRVVEENNLQAQISALRAVLGAERSLIRTVPGHGYQFTGEVRILPGSGEDGPEHVELSMAGNATPPSTNLPEPVSEVIGRSEELGELLDFVSTHRLVTLTGPGGIGKTTLALALSRKLRSHFPDGVWLAEFSALTDPRLVPGTVATTVGLELGGVDVSPQRVAQALAGRRLLLVLDTCEHIIDGAAGLAESVLRAGSAAHIIATSREALRTEGEQVYPVRPLTVPALHASADDDLSRYGAVALFVERVRAADLHFAPDRRVTAMIASICRQLDGIPLALELAAAHVAALGIDELVARLDDCFGFLTRGRRTALRRHQTLRATIDWSYALLAEPERVLLRRLAVFAGGFSLPAVGAVTADPERAPPDVVNSLSSLVAKSLVTMELGGPVARYRLLDTTRAYALEKLSESGEGEALAHRHAEYYRTVFERGEAELETRPAADWLAEYVPHLDNLRAALDWAFSARGAVSVGVALTIAAVPLWFQLSLVDECLGWVERALSAPGIASGPDEPRRMQLYAALGWLQMYAVAKLDGSTAAWQTALRLAEELGNADYQLRALWALWADRTNHAEFREALTLAGRFRNLSAQAGNAADQLVGERMTGASLHFLGDQIGARECIGRMLDRYTVPISQSQIVRFQFDQRVTARITLARVLWLQGLPDQSLHEVNSNIEHAVALDHTLSLCNALAQSACPIALLVGDFALAGQYTAMLRSHTGKNMLDVWRIYADCFDGEQLIRCGDLHTGLSLLRVAIDELRRAEFVQYHTSFVIALALGLLQAGHIDDARAMIDEALARCERTGERWALAELYRARGETLLKEGSGRNQMAEMVFMQALDVARAQKALSWELRAATSLARLLRGQARSSEALALLQPVYDRFTEGLETADLQSARALLDSVSVRSPLPQSLP